MSMLVIGEVSLYRKVAFAGIGDESESGSESGRNGQEESEGSLSEVSLQCAACYCYALHMNYKNK